LRSNSAVLCLYFFFFQAEDGIRDFHVTGVQTCALPICNCGYHGIERARPIGGNRLEHYPDSPRALDAMVAAIAAARATIHFENYIIRDDATGRRFADALAERAGAGVRVRVLYDALGSIGTSHRYWRGLRRAGAG